MLKFLFIRILHLEWLMQVPLILTLKACIMSKMYSVMYIDCQVKFFGLIEYRKNNVSMNKIEQEEQEDEHINAFDFLNNF